MFKKNHFNDSPTINDELGFLPSINALSNIINHIGMNDTPVTLGIFGSWGSGKTSLMQMLEQQLDSSSCIPIWFDAWRYSQADALWRAFLLSVVEELRTQILQDDKRLINILQQQIKEDENLKSATNARIFKQKRLDMDKQLDDLINTLYRSIERDELGEIQVDWKEAGKSAARIALRLGFSFIPVLGTLTKVVEEAQGKIGEAEDIDSIFNIFQREKSKIYQAQSRSLEQFYLSLNKLIKDWIVENNLRLVIFIDDLDRCLPEQALSVLETIKVFFDIQGCIFVIGMDRAIVEQGIYVRYKDFLSSNNYQLDDQNSPFFSMDGRDYLEKIIQVPFEIPPIEKEVITKFLRGRLSEIDNLSGNDAHRIAMIMAEGLQRNPRKVKRTLNTFQLLWALYQQSKQDTYPVLLAKLVVIQSSAYPIYKQLVDTPSNLLRVEEVARGIENSQQLRKLLEAFPFIEIMLGREPYFKEVDDNSLYDLVFQTRVTAS